LNSLQRENHITTQATHIGILSPDIADRPHFDSLRQMVPQEISLTNEGLGLLRDSYQNLAGQADQIVARATDFVQRNKVQGLLVTGGFVTLFNPGLEAKVAEAVGIPVASAVSSVVAALRAVSTRRLMLVTPFVADMNAVIAKHLESERFTVFLGPAFDKDRRPGAGVKIEPSELLRKVAESFRLYPSAEAIYFQGATLDPLPIIQQLEDSLDVPVVTSNTAMIWNILSKLGLRFSIAGYGRLLSSWPTL
jgi:maleate isomerase